MPLLVSLLSDILPLYALMLVGAVIGRIHNVRPDDFAKVTVYVLSPIAMFDLFASEGLRPSSLLVVGFTFSLATLFGSTAFMVGGRCFDSATRGLFGYACGLGNTLNFGLPICLVVLKHPVDEVTNAVLLHTLGVVLYSNTSGAYFVARGRYSPRQSLLRILKLPIIYAAILGILIHEAGITLPNSLLLMGAYSKGSLVVLGLLTVGFAFSSISSSASLRKAADGRLIALFLTTKFILWPLCAHYLLGVEPALLGWLTATQRDVIFLISFAPAAVNIVNYAAIFEVAVEKAVILVALSTALALFIIPIAAAVFF